MCAEQRKITNIALTGKYHWPYVKGWLLFTVFLTLLIESFALGCLHIVQTANPELSLTKYIVVSGLIAALVIVGLAARGTLWAHRIAGVHLRTESVFNPRKSNFTSPELSTFFMSYCVTGMSERGSR